jgi:hypothetical protein
VWHQVDDRDTEVLAERVGQVALVERAELDEERAEPLARDTLLEQRLGQLLAAELLTLDENLTQQSLATRGGRVWRACGSVC